MIKVLYLGNKFYSYKKVKSVLETLEPLLAEFCEIKTASDKQNQLHRFIDMLYHFFRFGIKADKIIIDVYSTKAFNFAYILSILSKLFNKKYILFLHGGNLPSRYERSSKKVTKIFKNACYIIAPSPYLKSFFHEKGFEIKLIPNIIELEKYPFVNRKNIRPNLLAIRGFGKPYNPLMTLQAVNELKKSVPNLKLLLLGNSDEYYYKEVIDYIQKNQLNNIVTVQPKCTRDEWVFLSSDYDIMISNPIIDNTPISLLEGMALGMHIISTKVGGVPYLVSENEINFVESMDYINLYEKILIILKNDLIYSKKIQNARFLSQSFSWSVCKNKWYDILK